MTRKGKIARLPRDIREQLNRRLDNGETQTALVEWLNSLPEVQAVLQAEFIGQQITEQNLSHWKCGGFCDWQLHQEALAMVQTITADTHALKVASPEPLTDKLALWLAARYAVAAQSVKGAQDWERLRELCFDIVALRKGDHSAARLKLDRDKFDAAQAQLKAIAEESQKTTKDGAPFDLKDALARIDEYLAGGKPND